MARSDIEIAQAAKLVRIAKLAAERLGIDDEHLVPYGHHKAKLSLGYIDSLKDRPNGKLVLVNPVGMWLKDAVGEDPFAQSPAAPSEVLFAEPGYRRQMLLEGRDPMNALVDELLALCHSLTDGLADLAEVRHSDYRDVRESGFDAVSSIGMTEHIGVANYPAYFKFLQSRLRPGGLLLNHCITRPDNRADGSAGGFIDRYVFPDGELTGSGRIITEMQNVGLEVMHEENLRHHYALTLRDWSANLVEHWDEAVAEVGLATAKVWGLYMAGSRLGFESNVVQLHQVLAVKIDDHGNDGGLPLRPWWTP